MTTQLVFIENERPVTDSLTVAAVFGKTHDHVMRDIRLQIGKLNEAGESEWGSTNFGETHYQHPQNQQLYPKYNLTEDAFAIVAMSYVTPEAMRMKVRFIEEFKRTRSQQTQLSVVPSYAIDNPIERAERWIAEERGRQTLQLETQRQATLLLEQAPKVTYYEQILRSPDALNVTQIASDYGISAYRLNGILRDADVQYRSGGQWVLRQAYASKGYTKSETFPIGDGRTRVYTKWTQKGRMFIHELLTERGIEAGGVAVVANKPKSQRRRKRPAIERKDSSSVLLTISLKG